MNITNSPPQGAATIPSSGGRDNPEQNSFISNIRTTGVQRTNSFFITIQPPRVLDTVLSANEFRDIRLYAESVNLPGVNFGTTQNRSYGIGYQERYVNDVTFNDLTISFINNGDMAMSRLFFEWMNKIVRFNTYFTSAPLNSQKPYEFEYKDDYIARDFNISVFDEKKLLVAEYRIFDVFPISMSDIGMNWGSTDEFARFTVNFAYSFWSVSFNALRNLR